MENMSVYVTVEEAVRVFHISSKDVLHFCTERKIGYARQNGDEETVFPSANDLSFVLKRAIPEDVVFAPLDGNFQSFEREKKEKIVTYTNGEMHHDDGLLLPPIAQKTLIEKETPLLIDDAINQPLIENDIRVSIDSSKEDESQNSIPPVPQLPTVPQVLPSVEDIPDIKPAPAVQPIDQKENAPVVLENESIGTPVFNVKPVFILKSQIVQESKEKNTTPQNPRPITGDKKIPVPHAPVSAPIGSLHPLANPPLVIPFATQAPAAHVKIAAVYTQPHARVVEWMPWMRTSTWLRKAVTRATKNPDITYNHPGLPVASSEDNRSSVQQVLKEVVPAIQNVETRTLVNDEKQAPVIRMEHPIMHDEIDRALFGNGINETKNETQSFVEEKPLPLQDSKEVVKDSWDALLFS